MAGVKYSLNPTDSNKGNSSEAPDWPINYIYNFAE